MCGEPSSTTCESVPGRQPRSRKNGNLPALRSAEGVRLRLSVGDLGELIDEFCRRFPNPKTAADYHSTLGRLFRLTGRSHPGELSEGDLIAFCAAGDPANNTVYQRLSKAATFRGWCHRNGVIGEDPSAHLRDRHSPLRTYGKVQAANPGRWLSHEEAYGRLVGACQDGTLVGLRDEIVIRLGLLGLRLSEIRGLDVEACLRSAGPARAANRDDHGRTRAAGRP